MITLGQDVSYGLRQLRRSPGAALVPARRAANTGVMAALRSD
jgi:hypothetical protein